LVDSSPDVIYRFEPFHRLSRIDREAASWFRKLKDQEVSDEDLPRIYSLLYPGNPLTNKAPFFLQKTYRLRAFGRRQLWPAARVFAPARWAYRRLYSPRPGPLVVFKEVTFIKPLRNLVERTSVPVVYLVRHPCATVLSTLRGPEAGTMPSRHLKLETLLRENAPQLQQQFASVIAGSDPISRTALLWLYEVESCVALCRGSKRAVIMTYEQLVSDPVLQTKRMFAHFGLQFGATTESFIESLYRMPSAAGKRVQRTGWGKKYYSILRNPADQQDSWKESMSQSDRGKVEAIVRDSPGIEYCASLGNWW